METLSKLVRHLRLRDLAYLVSLDKTRSIHRTAALHRISQPALSKILADVEVTFGAPLFERSRKGVTPTNEGKTVLSEAAQVLASIDALNDRLEAERQGRGRIHRVGATPNPALRLIPEAYEIVRRSFPAFRLELVEDSTDRLVEGMRRGNYSLIVGRSSPQDAYSALEQIPLYPESGVIVARPGHPLDGQDYVELGGLRSFPWVLPQPGPTRSAIELAFMRAGCNPPEPSFLNYSIHIVSALISRSDALSVLPLGPVSPFLKQGLMIELRSSAIFHLPSYAIYRPMHAAPDNELDAFQQAILQITQSIMPAGRLAAMSTGKEIP